MDTIRNRGVLALLNLSTIKRWQIVDMIRDQSVAEHQYRVWVLAQDLYEQVVDTPSNYNDKWAVHLWALVHDAEESKTGDIPTSTKAEIEELAPGVMDRVKEKVLARIAPWVGGLSRGVHGSLPGHVVKIADLCETIIYLRTYAISTERAIEVEAYLAPKIRDVITRAEAGNQRYDWNRARAWCRELLGEGPWEGRP